VTHSTTGFQHVGNWVRFWRSQAPGTAWNTWRASVRHHAAASGESAGSLPESAPFAAPRPVHQSRDGDVERLRRW
jgi:hypothetical protein